MLLKEWALFRSPMEIDNRDDVTCFKGTLASLFETLGKELRPVDVTRLGKLNQIGTLKSSALQWEFKYEMF